MFFYWASLSVSCAHDDAKRCSIPVDLEQPAAVNHGKQKTDNYHYFERKKKKLKKLKKLSEELLHPLHRCEKKECRKLSRRKAQAPITDREVFFSRFPSASPSCLHPANVCERAWRTEEQRQKRARDDKLLHRFEGLRRLVGGEEGDVNQTVGRRERGGKMVDEKEFASFHELRYQKEQTRGLGDTIFHSFSSRERNKRERQSVCDERSNQKQTRGKNTTEREKNREKAVEKCSATCRCRTM